MGETVQAIPLRIISGLKLQILLLLANLAKITANFARLYQLAAFAGQVSTRWVPVVFPANRNAQAAQTDQAVLRVRRTLHQELALACVTIQGTR